MPRSRRSILFSFPKKLCPSRQTVTRHVTAILFGSQATGDSTTNSDFDIMVVEQHTPNRFAERSG